MSEIERIRFEEMKPDIKNNFEYLNQYILNSNSKTCRFLLFFNTIAITIGSIALSNIDLIEEIIGIGLFIGLIGLIGLFITLIIFEFTLIKELIIINKYLDRNAHENNTALCPRCFEVMISQDKQYFCKKCNILIIDTEDKINRIIQSNYTLILDNKEQIRFNKKYNPFMNIILIVLSLLIVASIIYQMFSALISFLLLLFLGIYLRKDARRVVNLKKLDTQDDDEHIRIINNSPSRKKGATTFLLVSWVVSILYLVLGILYNFNQIIYYFLPIVFFGTIVYSFAYWNCYIKIRKAQWNVYIDNEIV